MHSHILEAGPMHHLNIARNTAIGKCSWRSIDACTSFCSVIPLHHEEKHEHFQEKKRMSPHMFAIKESTRGAIIQRAIEGVVRIALLLRQKKKSLTTMAESLSFIDDFFRA
jgi:hypothetical protein